MHSGRGGVSMIVAVTRLVALPHESRAIANQVFTWISSGDFNVGFLAASGPRSPP